MANIAFIGLGHMGNPMAKNLLKAGHEVKVYDLNQKAVADLSQFGAIPCKNIDELTAQSIFITMLQTGEQVFEVCLGKRGIYRNVSTNSLHIDCSSIDVKTAKEIHKQAQKYQIHCLDAPVSGGVLGAQNGLLTFMVGGDKTTFAAAKPLLVAMGKKLIHTGGAGTGQAAKICNNMILGISMAAISEAFILAEALGLSSEKLFEVSSNASGQCWALTSYCPVPGLVENVPANHNYMPGFSAKMMLKDLNLSQTASDSVGLNTRLGQTATKLYQAYVDSNTSEKDFSGIIQFLQQYERQSN